ADHAMTTERRNTNHSERMAIDRNTLVHKLEIGGGAALQIVKAEHRDGVAFLHQIVRGHQQTAECRLEPKHIEVSAENQLRVGQVRLVVPLHTDLRPSSGNESAENGIAVAQIAVHGVGKYLLGAATSVCASRIAA